MKLSTWLSSQGMTDTEFGRRIGKAHSTVLRLRTGRISPSLDTLQAIRDATGGAVTAEDFMQPMVAAPDAPIPALPPSVEAA